VSLSIGARPGCLCDMQLSPIITDKYHKTKHFRWWNVLDDCDWWLIIDHFGLGLMQIDPFLTNINAQKRFSQFRSQWPCSLTFRSQVCSTSYSFQCYRSTELEISAAFLLRENRKHWTDGQRTRCNTMWSPRRAVWKRYVYTEHGYNSRIS